MELAAQAAASGVRVDPAELVPFLSQGMHPAVVAEAIAIAARKGKDRLYLVGILRNRLSDPPASGTGYRVTRAEVDKLARPGESYEQAYQRLSKSRAH